MEKINTILAVLYTVIGVNLVTISDVIMRMMAVDFQISTVQTTLYRSIVMLLIVICIFIFTKRKMILPAKNIKWQLARGFIYGFTILCVQYAMFSIPMTQATAILFISPFVTAILGHLILKERNSFFRYFLITMGFIGVLIVINPTDFEKLNYGHLSAVIAGIGMGFYAISGKMVSKDYPPLMQYYFVQIFSITPIFVISLFLIKTIEFAHMLPAILAGVFGFGYHYLFMRALDLKEASFVSPFLFTQIIGITISSYIAFNEIPTFNVIMGALLTISASIIMVYSEYKKIKN